MHCEQCQHELPDDALFCDRCGARQNAPQNLQDKQARPETPESPAAEVAGKEAEAENDLDAARSQDSDKGSKPEPELQPTPKHQQKSKSEPEPEPRPESTRASKPKPEQDPDEEPESPFGETEEAPLPEIETMRWAAESGPTIAPPTFPEEPRLPRSTIISIAIISIAIAVLLLLLAAWTVLGLLHV